MGTKGAPTQNLRPEGLARRRRPPGLRAAPRPSRQSAAARLAQKLRALRNFELPRVAVQVGVGGGVPALSLCCPLSSRVDHFEVQAQLPLDQRMAYLSPSCDDALFQWASACLPRSQAGLCSLHELADSQALVDMVCRFVNIPASQMSSQPDDSAQPWERRTWIASALAAVKPPGVISPEEAHAGGPPAARGLVAAVLLSAVEGPEQHAAVTCITGLHASHQACLANVLQQLMSMGTGTSGPRSRSPNQRRASQMTDRGSYMVCHSTSNLRTSVGTERLFEGNLSRGASTSVDRRLSSLDDSAPYEARQLHEELEEYTQKAIQLRKAQQRCQKDLSEAKVMMYQEADMCHDLDEDLSERECEHSELMGQMGLLKQELHAESYIAESEDRTLERLHQELTEQTRQYNDLDLRHTALEEKLLALQTNGPTKKQSWKRSAALAKIARVKDDIAQKSEGLRIVRAAQARGGKYTQILKIELAEAEQALTAETSELEEMTERLHVVSDGLHKSEKELDTMSTELKAISSASIDDLRQELEKSKFSTEQAERAHADAILRVQAAERRLQPVEAAFAAAAAAAAQHGEVDHVALAMQTLEMAAASSPLLPGQSDDAAYAEAEAAAQRAREEKIKAQERRLLHEEQEEEKAIAAAEAAARAAAKAAEDARRREEEAEEQERRRQEEEARERQEAEARQRALEIAAAEAEAAADLQAREELEEKLQQERLAQAERAEQLAAEAREARRAKKEALAAEKAEAKVQRKEAREEERAKALQERAARTAALQQRHAATVATELAISRSELESAEDEAQQLRKDIAVARRKQQDAQEEQEAHAASAREAQTLALAASKAESEVSLQATVLELQIVLREREQAHRESLAGEMEAAHQKELRLLAAALHRLGVRYGRALGQSESQEEDAAARG